MTFSVAEPQPPWDSPALFPAKEPARLAKYRRLQSKYRHEVLHAKPGRSGKYTALGSYLDADEVSADPKLNFISTAALEHANEREAAVRAEGGALDPLRLRRNMLSSMPLCFNLFGTMRVESDFLGVFQDLFDSEALSIVEIICEWAPQPPSQYLGDGTAFDAVTFYETAQGRRFFGIETKYTEPFSQREYASSRYDELTESSGWFNNPATASHALKGSKSNQLWRNLLLAASVEAHRDLGTGRVAVVALSDDPGAKRAIDIVKPELSDPNRLLWMPIELILRTAGTRDSLAKWARDFERRYVG